MAYSCVKVLFEIGHEASRRAKHTLDGFTHDWEVFVRGAENSEIHHFVEKVVFYLHGTFPKPKRVVKQPPYSVKESGYAGFNLPIEIYFKNSDEPKKVCFNYDLHLQPSGPPITKVLREQYVFPNPAEDLRRRLIKGGGVGVGSETNFHASDKPASTANEESSSHKHTSTLVGKPKLSGSDSSKKHKSKESKSEESRAGNPFRDLFGPPIKTAKVSPDPKKSSSSSSSSHSPKVSPVSKSSKVSDKSSSEKSEKPSKSSKHGSHKEGKDTERSSSSSSGPKDEKKDKEKNKDKEKSKDKSLKTSSTPVKHPSTPPKRPTSPKRPSSPSPSKRSSSPKRSSPSKLLAPPPAAKLSLSPKHSSSTKSSKEDIKRTSSEEIKSKSESKDENRSEKKKKDKKNKDEKVKKEKHKEHDKSTEKVKSEKLKDHKEKESSKKNEKEPVKESEKTREKEKDKSRHSEGDKEKQRHKHKKKDRSNKDREKEDKDREKNSKKSSESKMVEIRDKEKNGLANESSRGSVDTNSDISSSHKKLSVSSTPSPVRVAVSPLKPSPTPEKAVSCVSTKDKLAKHPLNVLYENVAQSSDSNSSALSGDEDLEPPVSRIKATKFSENVLSEVESKNSMLPVPDLSKPDRSENSKPKLQNSNQEKNNVNKSSSKQKEKSSRKNKDKDTNNSEIEKTEKDSKKRKRKSSNRAEVEGDSVRNNGESAAKISKVDAKQEQEAEMEVDAEIDLQLENEPSEKTATEEIEVKEESDMEMKPPPDPTDDYVLQLRELQQNIMNLDDNDELQRVVQVIAETGQYEITKKTFDFDLLTLDRNTVKKLQEFFAPS